VRMRETTKHIHNNSNAPGKSISPALRCLIKFLAQIAVEQYLDELRASEKLPHDGGQPACDLHEAEACFLSTNEIGDSNA
jgi:hypothetical protein